MIASNAGDHLPTIPIPETLFRMIVKIVAGGIYTAPRATLKMNTMIRKMISVKKGNFRMIIIIAQYQLY